MDKDAAKRITNDKIYRLFLNNINGEIDRTIEEVMEMEKLTSDRVLEDYRLEIKKALFISRNEI